MNRDNDLRPINQAAADEAAKLAELRRAAGRGAVEVTEHSQYRSRLGADFGECLGCGKTGVDLTRIPQGAGHVWRCETCSPLGL